MATLGEFSKRIRKIGNRVISGSDLLVKRGALAIETNLVIENPVLTGRSKANWFVSIGQEPSNNEIEAQPPGEEGETGAQNIAFALAQAKAVLAGKRKSGQPIYIANNLPYIEPLNEGLSPQTEPGYIERSIDNGLAVIRQGKIL